MRIRPRPARLFLPAVLLATALGLVALGLTACDSGGEDEGRFENLRLVFSDGSAGTLQGRALFSAGENGTLRIELVPRSRQGGFREGLVLARAGGSALRAGRYGLAPPDDRTLPANRFAGALQISFDGSAPALYYAQRGTLIIEEVTEDRLEGRLQDVEAVRREAGGSGNAPLSVTITDSFFRAERSDAIRRFPL